MIDLKWRHQLRFIVQIEIYRTNDKYVKNSVKNDFEFKNLIKVVNSNTVKFRFISDPNNPVSDLDTTYL